MIRLHLRELLDRKAQRERKRWSCVTAGNAAGVSHKVIEGWVNGTVGLLEADTIVKLCEYLNCSVDELIEYVPDAENDLPGLQPR